MILPFPDHVILRASSWFSSKRKKKKSAVKSQRSHGGNLSEISPFEKATYCATPTMWHSEKAKLLLCSVQSSSVAQSCPTLCDPMNCSTPGLPGHHQLPKFTQTHIHRVSDAIQPSISSSVIPFSSCPQSLPASESFPMSQLFAWGGQSTGVSA